MILLSVVLRLLCVLLQLKSTESVINNPGKMAINHTSYFIPLNFLDYATQKNRYFTFVYLLNYNHHCD